MTPGRRSDLLLDRVRSLFDGSLASPRGGTDVTVAQRIGDFLLALGECRGLGKRAVQGVERFLFPCRGQRVAPMAELVGKLRERIGRFLARAAGAARVALTRGPGGFLH